MNDVTHIIRTVISIILLLTLIGCSSSATNTEPTSNESEKDEVVLTISGSGSTTAILEAVKPTFESDTPGYRLDVLPGSGTGGGVKGVIQGLLDVAAMARGVKEEEAAQDVQFVPLGQGATAIITHPGVGVTELTNEEIVALFSGELTNWSEVGGGDLPIILYVRDEGDSSTKALRKALLGETPFSEKVAQVVTSQGNMLTAVEGTPGSIGLATWPTTLAKGTKVEAIAIEGVMPNESTYPMLVSLGIGYLTERQPDVQPLIEWLDSDSGQSALQKLDILTNQ